MGQCNETTPLLAAEQGNDSIGLNFDAVVPLEIKREGFTQLGNAPIGLIGKGSWFSSIRLDGIQYEGRGREVRTAHAEVDDVHSG